jgi:hypothetical protein
MPSTKSGLQGTMNSSLAEIILASNNTDEEGTFWIQLLVLIVLGAVVGIGSLIKTRAKRFKTQEQHGPEGGVRSPSHRRRQIEAFQKLKDKYVEITLKTEQPKTIIKEPKFDFEAAERSRGGKQVKETDKATGRDVASGMEILELDFLLSIVEKTKGRNKKDVMMRKLVFNELVRRQQLGAVDSGVLNVYILNKSKLYSKDIQCEAMKALAERTKHSHDTVLS